ncbi:MAG: hypothetical protein EOO16_04470 [Chitinophagaceae bacterium]|nr:MAG: hypothetical protein EOO16_04470 [Chitinophagaceae bacterium]
MLLTEEVYRPQKAMALLPLIAPAVLGLILYSQKSEPEAIHWIVAAVSLAAALVAYILLRAAEIRIDGHGMVIKTITGERMFPWERIKAVWVRWRHTGQASWREIVFEQHGGRTVTMTTSLYSRKSLQAIASAVISMAPQARIDERLHRFSQGNFSWFGR